MDGSKQKIINQGIIEAELSNVCRGCLRNEVDMKDIFHMNNQESSKFINMFYDCTSIQILLNDEMPSFMCKRCEEDLIRANSFKIRCIASQEILQKHVLLKREELSVRMFLKPLTNILTDTLEALGNNDKYNDNASDVHLNTEIPIDGKRIFDQNDIEEEEENSESEKEEVTGMIKEQQKLRLTQYSVEAVDRALQNAQNLSKEITRECRHCGFLASTARGLRVHVSHIHKHLLDTLCAKCCEFVPNIDDHVNCQSQYVCEFCDKNFSTKTHLMEHLRSHTFVRPFICSVCAKSFISDRHLKVHLRTHSGEKPFRCKICDKKFSQKSAMRSHVKVIHKDEDSVKDCFKMEVVKNRIRIPGKKIKEESCLCTECGKTFSHNSKLRLHMRVHTGELPYCCSHCERRFSTRSQMMVHVRVHTGERPHVCSVCGKRFAQSSVLNTHMRIHTGRPEQCQICCQRFCRPAELRLHMRKHTGEKPYECKECGQAFRQASHLTQHRNTHSEDRPFKCTHCERAFKQNSSLKSHVHIHTGYKPFQCTKCYYACRQSYSLTQHMKTHALDTK